MVAECSDPDDPDSACIRVDSTENSTETSAPQAAIHRIEYGGCSGRWKSRRQRASIKSRPSFFIGHKVGQQNLC
jgi:hypothetical protein